MNKICTRRTAVSSVQEWRMRLPRSLLWLGLIAGVCGCQSVKDSAPARTATEDPSISAATDRALANARFPWLEGQRVFVEDKVL